MREKCTTRSTETPRARFGGPRRYDEDGAHHGEHELPEGCMARRFHPGVRT